MMKPLIKLIIVTAVMLSANISFAAKPLVIDSFNDGNSMSQMGGWWYTYTDAGDGGSSTVSPSTDNFRPSKSSDSQGYAARMHGTAGNRLGWDYFGMGVTLGRKSDCPQQEPVDLHKYSKLQFKIKGKIKGGRLTVILPYVKNSCKDGDPVTRTGWADYEVSITSLVTSKWTTVTLDFRKDFFQPDWAKPGDIISIEKVLKQMHTIDWHYSSQDGESADIWIDDVVLK